ncbi:MAG: cyclase family protein [Calditrichia bacterium]
MLNINDRGILDISLSLSPDLPVWPGDPPVEIRQTASIKNGDMCNASRVSTSFHWGTHMDAPRHFFDEGWSIDQIPPHILVGPATVIEIPNLREIDSKALRLFDLSGVERLLIKTGNSAFWKEKPLIFHPEFASLTGDAAELLLNTPLKLLGIDYLSIDLFDSEDLPVHHRLYQKNIVAVEGLDLNGVEAGVYDLICLPLKVAEGDGAPARVLLIPKNK